MTEVSPGLASEEAFFLAAAESGSGLRNLAEHFGETAVTGFGSVIAELIGDALLTRDGDTIRLTPCGRMLSNDVFRERFLFLCDEPAAIL